MVRGALNVPVENGKVVNTFRLRKALPTLKFLQEQHARIVLVGHLGEKGTETLQPVYEAMREMLSNISFCPVSTGPAAQAAVRDLTPGSIVMLENLRRDKGETGNDPVFVKALSELADVFVEDAFDVCHRAHASVVGVPQLLPSYAGLLVEEEVVQLSKALKPAHPAFAIIGGAKFSTKEPVLRRLLETYDRVAVGGALGNDFTKAAGYGVGASLTSDTDAKGIKELLGERKLLTRVDAVVAPKGGMHDDGRVASITDVKESEAILDEGPETVARMNTEIQKSKLVLWNGPLGLYENGFLDATNAIARAIAGSQAFSILGGGDTVAAVEDLKLSDKFSFISTGGGAMLDFLAKGTLPGLQVLEG